jgi:hypothetical protein
MRLTPIAATIAFATGAAVSAPVHAQAVEAPKEWPDGPNKRYFKGLQRPDNHLRQWDDDQPLTCCGEADTVKTRFKVEASNGPHPNDIWYAWLEEKWVRIPPEKIVPDFAPDGQAYLFVFRITDRNGFQYNQIVCFVRPKGGL